LNRIVISLLLVISVASGATAQYAAQLSDAGTVLKGSSIGGGYVGIYDGAFGILGQYRYGIGGYTDIGGKLGIIDLDSGSREGNVGFLMAIDSKYQVMEVRIMDPIDLSIGGTLEFSAFNHLKTFVVGGYAVGSYPVTLKNGRILSPYGRLIMGFNRGDPDWGASNTEFDLALNLGVSMELSSSTHALGEIQIDDDAAAFLMGLEFGL
jgi:hypothetical protein